MDIKQIHSYPSQPRKRPKISQKKSFCDSFGVSAKKQTLFGFQDVMFNRKHASQTMLGGASSNRHRSAHFVTEDSNLYLSGKNVFSQIFGKRYIDARKYMDSVHARNEMTYSKAESFYIKLNSSYLSLHEQLHQGPKLRTWDLSPVRMWQMSMACAMVFGMITMGMIYKNLGQSALAEDTASTQDVLSKSAATLVMDAREENTDVKRLPVEDKIYSEAEIQEQQERESVRIANELQQAAAAQKKAEQEQKIAMEEAQNEQKIAMEEAEAQKVIDAEKAEFENKVRDMVAGYPIENMVDEILKLDREVAIYMIAMAKQESQWGKRKPVLNGQDCLNYWGFRAKRERMGSGGHTCFDDTEDAVTVVGRRVHELIYEYKRTTPESMLVWKCGRSCEGHSPEGVRNWVNTVTMYRDALKS